jgi:predicted DNA-binding transcriptional regulator AlpA
MEERFLKIKDVEQMVEYKKSQISAWRKAGLFPSGCTPLGGRSRRWPLSQIQGWINQQIKDQAGVENE